MFMGRMMFEEIMFLSQQHVKMQTTDWLITSYNILKPIF